MSERDLTNRVLLGPGPSNVNPRVTQSMLKGMLGHLDPEFWPITDQVCAMLREVFHTKGDFTLPISATGMAGMESAFCNLIEPGDKVVVIVNGFFGTRMVDVASRCGADVHKVDVPWGSPVLPEIVEDVLKKESNVKAVAFVHAETSTGVLSPIKEITGVIHEHEALVILDVVTSLGGVKFLMDEWDVDVCYSASQKCLGAPPGMSPISFSGRAIDSIKARKTQVQSYYLDILNLKNYWSKRKMYHHTAPILMIYALREALLMMMEEGLENRWARHSMNAAALRAGLESLGLELLADPKYRAAPLTTVKVPDGIEASKVIQALYGEYNLEIGNGLGDFKDKIWRIGLMGDSCKSSNVLMLLSALENVLPKQGFETGVGVAVAEAERVLLGK